MRVLSIDPGVNGCGVAMFSDNVLKAAAYVPGDLKTMAGNVYGWQGDPEILVVEKPQVYREAKLKGDPNDLIDLAIVVGTLAERFHDAGLALYLPRTWKGQVPKVVMRQRIANRLSHEEFFSPVLPSASLSHNVWDAIGIGLFHLGRLK